MCVETLPEDSLIRVANKLGVYRVWIGGPYDHDPATMYQTFIAIRDKDTNAATVLHFRSGNLIKVERYPKQPEGVVGKPEVLWSS